MNKAHTTIGATEKYALDELDAIAKKLESTKVGELAKKSKEAEPEVQKWPGLAASNCRKRSTCSNSTGGWLRR